MSSQIPSNQQRITIIGAGIFGLTTALELAERGYNVLVLDRNLPPVSDGASVDISRVIRPDYADPFYAKMGIEAMQGWEREYSRYFYRSGLLCISRGSTHSYLESSRENLEKMGLQVQSLQGGQLREHYPAIQGDLTDAKGYFNPVSGWADAQQSMQHLVQKCGKAGVSFLTGRHGTITSLVKNKGKITALETSLGTLLEVSTLILATGAWTPHLIDMDRVSISTGQPVGFMELTVSEADLLRDIPVIINLSTGWFIFPPTPDKNILKMARHGYGYETIRKASSSSKTVSAPMLDSSNTKSAFIPDDAERALKDGLSSLFPQFQQKQFSNRRLCWYADTSQGDFIVDYHPEYKNLFVATGDSGHAFKFLPVLGRYVADTFERKASETQEKKWRWRKSSEPISRGDGSRGGPPRRTLKKEEQAKL